ncbi:gastric triacylglycerol lipase-like [Ornithodoros turicata]|uniref:gastric triacylglycerol lipase-like n=1 Tax=Ornithodoros turicata TaxID=34597 RepID=UPI003138B50A
MLGSLLCLLSLGGWCLETARDSHRTGNGFSKRMMRTLGLASHWEPDMERNVSELIASKGYPVEEYTIMTRDGYIFGIQRIPYGRWGPSTYRRSGSWTGVRMPVLLLHGILQSSVDFVINMPDQSLGFMLADEGYDVWLANTRGNTYGKRHAWLDPDSEEFWDFSFDEIALYDTPATIDFILLKTGMPWLYTVGFSQGNRVLFALISEKPHYNDKIKVIVAMAPYVTAGYMLAPLRKMYTFADFTKGITDKIGKYEYLPNNHWWKLAAKVICPRIKGYACAKFIMTIFGGNPLHMNMTRFPVYFMHIPAGTSVKNMAHYGQLVKSITFSKYDYDREENLRRYGQETPPEYDLSKTKVPVAALWSLTDRLSNPVDVRLMRRNTPHMIMDYRVPKLRWSHLDFVWSPDACHVVYPEVMKILNKMDAQYPVVYDYTYGFL